MAIIQEYLTTEISLTQMVKKYHIGWTTIPKWMRKFGIPMPNEAPVQIPMSEETKKPEKKDTVEALEARLQELQAELDREKLKNLALNTMIEVAEEELQIDIRKKYKINVLTIKRNNEVIMPSAETVIQQDDVAFVLGESKDIHKIFKL